MKTYNCITLLLISFFLVASQNNGFSQDGTSIRPSAIFGDNMMLQRGEQFKIWGKGNPGDRVQISFQGLTKMMKVPESGNWSLLLKKPNVGGPYKLTINKKTFKDIYVGDIWMAGGQSNMEWPMKTTNGFEEELALESLPHIHFFRTPKVMHNTEIDSLSGGKWKRVKKDNLSEISAVSYFFAKKIYSETNVPIGIVDHSWGGSDIEGWLPFESFENDPDWSKIVKDFQNRKIDPVAEAKALEDWYEGLETKDLGNQENWEKKTDNWDGWKEAVVPGYWENNGLKDVDGVVWLTHQFTLQQESAESCILSLGQIDDSDHTYINGELVGSMKSYSEERNYTIDPSLLKKENVLTVRITDYGWGGGFSSKPEELFIQCNDEKISLIGEWKFKQGTKNYPKMPVGISLNNLPANRYNAMMVPLFQFPMTGMIWYQGETNCSRPETYSAHFHEMIRVYREKWGHDFPFLFVQLANYMEEKEPGASLWAELRSAQESVLDMPKTAMATAIDIGEADDIHPRNKKDVGERLANGALSIEYGKDIRYKNPHISSVSISPKEIVLEFAEIADGLVAKKPKTLPAFHVILEDGTTKRVKARLFENKVYVKVVNMKITQLYYAWADNPGKLDLYNTVGLPVLPFKVDINYE